MLSEQLHKGWKYEISACMYIFRQNMVNGMQEMERLRGSVQEVQVPLQVQLLYNSFPPGQNGAILADINFKCIFLIKITEF